MQKYIHTTWRLWKLLKPFHKDFYIQLFFIIITQIFNIAIIFLTAKILDFLINKDFISAYYIAIIIFILSLIKIIMAYFVDMHAQNKLDFQIQQHLEEYSFERIFNLNPHQYQEGHSAIKLQVINRGENSTQNIISTIVFDVLPTITQIIFSIGAIFLYSANIAIISILTLGIVMFWSNKFANYHKAFVKEDMDNWDNQRKIRSETFQHLYLVKIFSVYDNYLKKYLQNRKRYIEYKIFVWVKSLSHGTKRWSFFTLSRLTSTLTIIYEASLGLLSVSGIYAIWRWLDDAYGSITNIIRAIRQLPLRFVELEKYLEIIDKEPDFEEESDTKFVDGDITFSNLSFKYPKGDSNVLENININIPHGKKVAFVGASGSGKTTITRLLLRAYDYNNTQDKNENKLAGSIKINGVELKEIDAHSLRRSIGYVEQHVDLFDDTIKNNILLGVDEKILKESEKENLVDEKLEEIAKLARIDEFYHRLGEQKFETHIGERGIKLSGGERQRIGIARAIIKNPSILIFDEATSALDTVNEKYIKEAIDNVSKGRTTIIIAHRLSTVVDSDIIFVMNLGKVVASGTHTELLEKSEYYQELIKHQELK